jgi:antitoxin YefM
MIALKTIDLRNDFKRVSDLVTSGEKVLIARPHNENIVIISEKEYNELEKARRNAEYLKKIDRSQQDFTDGKTYTFTIDELEIMENMTTDEMQAFADKHRGKTI